MCRPQESSTWHWIKLAGVKRCEGCFYIVWRYSWCNQFALSNCTNQWMSARYSHSMAVSARMLHDRRSVASKEENSLSTSSTLTSRNEHEVWLNYCRILVFFKGFGLDLCLIILFWTSSQFSDQLRDCRLLYLIHEAMCSGVSHVHRDCTSCLF